MNNCMIRKMLLLLLCIVLLTGCHAATDQNDGVTQEQTIPPEVVKRLDEGNLMTGVLYGDSYRTIDDLLAKEPLIVRATPVSIESESAVALRWLLTVAEASREEVHELSIKQVKDEYMLEAGREVVLALLPDEEAGFYYIAGGGAGLFRSDARTGDMTGLLLDSLWEEASAVNGIDRASKLTAEQVYRLLTKQS